MGFKDFLGILQWKKAETNHFTEDLGDTSHKIGYTDLSWLVQDWVYPKIAKWCTVPTKNGGIPPKTLENQVDSVRMWTKDIPQLLFCLQTVHTMNTFISWLSAGMGPQFKILVRIQNAGQGPRVLRGFGVTLRARADPCSKNNGGVVMHPANMAWFGDFLCQKRGCSIFPKVGVKTCKKIGRWLAGQSINLNGNMQCLARDDLFRLPRISG